MHSNNWCKTSKRASKIRNILEILFVIFIITLVLSFFFYKTKCSTKGKVTLIKSAEIIENNDEIEITVNLQNVEVSAYNFYLYFDENKFEYVQGEENTNIVQNKLIHVWYDKQGGSGSKSGEIAKFKFKAKENGTVNFVLEGEFYSESGQQIETEIEQVQVQIGKGERTLESQVSKTDNIESANTNLETLAIENAMLNKPFENTVTKYETEVSKDTQNLKILAIPENEQATVEISGKDELQEGNNNVIITVTAQNGITKRQYEINVYKRNEEEEEKYAKEQEENRNNLEKIFETEKLSTQENTTSQDEKSKNENAEQSKKVAIIAIVAVLTVSAIFIIIILVKILNKRRGRK